MNQKKWLMGAVCAAALLAAVPASAQMNVTDKTTHVTFNTTVELPGLTLPPGTYTFKLKDHTVNRHIVQVFDRDGKKLGSDILAMPARRMERTDETVVTFHEVPANMTPAVRFWFYPNDQVGEEFAYPKERALQLAAATGTSVLAVEGEDLTRVEAEAAAAATAQERPEAAPTPTPAPTAQPEAQITAREQDTVGTAGATRRRLPQTASSLPLVGLIGLLSLGGAMAIRRMRMSRG